MNNIFWVIIAIVVISTIVGAVAKMLNNLNEMNTTNAGRARPMGGPPDGGGGAGGGAARAGGGGGGAVVRQSNTDMDRFLAEIDRLRKKTAEAPPPPPNQTPAAPVVQPEKRPDRPRPRVVAEVADPPKQDFGFAAPPPPSMTVPRVGELPVAAVVAPPSTTGGPATRVTRLAVRARPVAKTPFAKNLTSLLATSQGLALAIVLQEILGPPKTQKR